MAENLPLWSMRTLSESFLDVDFDPAPTFGNNAATGQFSFARPILLQDKIDPGLRCNWLTTTRSAPLMMNSPPPSMTGKSPKYTSSSYGSSLSNRRWTRKGDHRSTATGGTHLAYTVVFPGCTPGTPVKSAYRNSQSERSRAARSPDPDPSVCQPGRRLGENCRN